ncbi:MAG TPA: EAL domain-containing protein [Acidimicrobiales bacterium]|nr:EAL domain-containing protein [Acidimicrobiales bacterium]
MGSNRSSASGPSGRARLGAELQRHADRIAASVLEWWLANRPDPSPPDPVVTDDILRVSRLGAMAIGRFLISGELPGDDERATISSPAVAALHDRVPLDELTKLYLANRDITCRELAGFARQLDVDGASLRAAQDTTRLGIESAIVGVIRSFETARRSLEEELSAERERLAHNAVHDTLTGLPNRTLLTDRLDQLLPRRSQGAARMRGRSRFAALFIDIDRFKSVNDLGGHRAGDDLLVAVAQRLRAVIRRQDTLARLGGDEFVVLCPDLVDPAAEAAAVAERITAVMHQPFRVGPEGREFYVSASVGIGLAGFGDTAESILARADAAMYAAKSRGGGIHQIYDDSVDSALRRRPELVNELHAALARGELSLHYQPVMHLGTDQVRYMEALARWCHPRLGPVPPDEFIPLAEETGVIVPLGRWVITQALADCAAWRARTRPGVGVAVNVSGRQLSDAGLADHLAATLQATGLDPAEVTLEITESVLVSAEAGSVPALDALKATGVRLAIDDFGTGYSSLAYLRQLPVETVKVDRSFISGLDAAGGDAAIVAAMVELAHSLGLSVVAEGVETAGELEIVRRAGCDEAQGYLLGRPAPACSAPVQDLAASSS